MMYFLKIISTIVLVSLLGCGSTEVSNEPPSPVIDQSAPEITETIITEEIAVETPKAVKDMIFNVQLGIHPTQTHWVLFENGSYLIFPAGTSNEAMQSSAIKLLTSFTGTMVNQRKSALAKGWITLSKKRISNYVDPSQLANVRPTDLEIRAQGKRNILRDIQSQRIIRINGNE